MARNQEKAQSLLNRWTSFKSDIRGGKYNERPKRFYGQCYNLDTAEDRRKQIIGEMSKRIKKMQDESLSEYQLREINDEINHLHRRRTNYEKQIIRLGGLDYSKNKVFDDEGKEVPGGNGYRYYGLAKDIPGIRELLVPVKRKRRVVKKSLKEIQQSLDLDYFGFHSAEREKELLKLEEEASRVYKEKIKQSLGTPNDNSENSDSEVTDYEDMIDFDALEKEESERRILEEKKRQLVEKYCKLK